MAWRGRRGGGIVCRVFLGMIAQRVGFFWWRDVIRALREEVGYIIQTEYHTDTK